eukprot:TRINITY_DN1840_c0_g1_i2.p1 TRINITY_DN1840_c0_g1~~TRINITY_DN1840_c0_g1_i2.p1  ORF type:complete len:409 (+),score=60.79 TRINITY_DN1840_c0_g1_i2:1004-2230(+)
MSSFAPASAKDHLGANSMELGDDVWHYLFFLCHSLSDAARLARTCKQAADAWKQDTCWVALLTKHYKYVPRSAGAGQLPLKQQFAILYCDRMVIAAQGRLYEYLNGQWCEIVNFALPPSYRNVKSFRMECHSSRLYAIFTGGVQVAPFDSNTTAKSWTLLGIHASTFALIRNALVAPPHHCSDCLFAFNKGEIRAQILNADFPRQKISNYARYFYQWSASGRYGQREQEFWSSDVLGQLFDNGLFNAIVPQRAQDGRVFGVDLVGNLCSVSFTTGTNTIRADWESHGFFSRIEGAAAACLGDQLYIFGGNTSPERNTLVKICTNVSGVQKFVKQKCANAPRGRVGMSCLAFQKELWVIGGNDPITEKPLQHIDVYNPDTDTWRTETFHGADAVQTAFIVPGMRPSQSL